MSADGVDRLPEDMAPGPPPCAPATTVNPCQRRRFECVRSLLARLLLDRPSPVTVGDEIQPDATHPEGIPDGLQRRHRGRRPSNLFIVTDLGYQAGFQSVSDGDLYTNYLHLGAGFAIGL